MRLLMLKQPWLNLIILKHKKLETRMWDRGCSYRGEILLASSQISNTLQQVKDTMTGDQFNVFLEIRQKLYYDIFKPTSSAGCVVSMVDYRPMNQLEDVRDSFVSFDPRRKVLCLENVRPVVSFPVKGMLGLLNCPQKYLEQIKFD